MDLVAERAQLVVELAFQEWARGVPDTDGSADVLRYFHDGLGWAWVRDYRNGRKDQQWCGAFAAYCWGRGGLLPDIRLHDCAGVTRLLTWASGTPRLLPPEQALPGDFLLIGGADPTHIGLAVEPFARGVIPTIEGNSIGARGNHLGEGEGVVKHLRPVRGPRRFVHHVVRPLVSDLEAA